jgi:hypothetical protein
MTWRIEVKKVRRWEGERNSEVGKKGSGNERNSEVGMRKWEKKIINNEGER